MKRRSIANLDRHQPTFSSLYQLNQINDPRSSLYQRLHHHSYNMTPSQPRQSSMWHARSYESGIGNEILSTDFSSETHIVKPLDSEFIESPYQLYGRLPSSRDTSSRGYISSNSGAFRNSQQQLSYVGDWEWTCYCTAIEPPKIWSKSCNKNRKFMWNSSLNFPKVLNE